MDYKTLEDYVGNTPLVRLQRIGAQTGNVILAKLEGNNPAGSVKDRPAMSMIARAEQAGAIRPGDTLIEATSGNTGIALAMAAAIRGYRMILVMPENQSVERRQSMRAFGAELVLTPKEGGMELARDMAERMRDDGQGVILDQFGNPDNPLAHRQTTGPEILEQMEGRVDAIVFGCGSSGTMTGLSQYFAEHSPETEFILADPVGSILAEYINDGILSDKSASWMVEGIGEDFLPDISDFSRVTKAYPIPDKESFLTARELLSKEGILGGSSTGTLVAAALRYCKEQVEPKRVVVFVCDTGNKYLSKMYNDYWMLDNGFLERERHGDLRDLILRPYSQRDTVIVSPKDLLVTAYNRMKLYDVSQLPVMEGDAIVGILDESDVLMHVYGDETKFRDPVSTAMISRLEKLDVTAPIEALLPVFDAGHVAIVMDGEKFLGLITRIDLLNYLRRRVQ